MLKKNGMDKREAGYSFIELMIAVTVLALVMVPLLSLMVSGYAAMVTSGNQTVAVNLCREKIEEIKANGYKHYAELMDGAGEEINEYLYPEENVPSFPHYSWETRITRETRLLGSEFTVDLMEILVTVYWIQQDTVRSVSMESELTQR